jgi:hypothetical protein
MVSSVTARLGFSAMFAMMTMHIAGRILPLKRSKHKRNTCHFLAFCTILGVEITWRVLVFY